MLPAVFALAANSAVGVEAISVVDDIGRTVTLERPAGRIVSLAPHVTENLFAAGVGEQVAGVVSYSDYPPAARRLPLVGGYNNISIEAILALQPDLVIAWKEGNQYQQVERLMKLGVTVFVTEPSRLEDVAGDIVRYGILGGREAHARRVAQQYRASLSRLRNQYSGLEQVSVFYQVWPNPLITVTDRQLIGKVIRLCSGRNIFAGLDTPTPQVSTEAVLTANPDVVIASGMNEARPDWLDEWQRWSFLNAARYANLFFIDPDIIQRHTPRILLGARQLCEILEQSRKNISAARPAETAH
ncbi:MAG: cobalamin-binding protein [Gammaproteobacteria bacterium]|nr:cobalamin-binding protein [Gammaproteobacteria bacterium]